jgi:hypothetical protein
LESTMQLEHGVNGITCRRWNANRGCGKRYEDRKLNVRLGRQFLSP